MRIATLALAAAPCLGASGAGTQSTKRYDDVSAKFEGFRRV